MADGEALYGAFSAEQVDALPDAAFATDPWGSVVAWNHAAERLLGTPVALAVGHSCAALMDGVDRSGQPVCSNHCPLRLGLVPTRRSSIERWGRAGVAAGPQRSTQSGGSHPDMLIRGNDGGRRSVAVVAFPAFLDGSPVLLHMLRDAPLCERDPLTGTLSRDGFAVRALDEQNRARRTGVPVALALVDVDGLKMINDTNGHDTGDRVLLTVARALRGGRREDLVGRWGGDEFVVLLPETDRSEAVRRLWRTLHSLSAKVRVGGQPVTFSAGVVDLDPHTPLTSNITAADVALYRAKVAGRARVVTGQALPWEVARGHVRDRGDGRLGYC